MIRKSLILLMLPLLLLLNACAPATDRLTLNPAFSVPSFNYGEGKTLGVRVSDKREIKNFGTKAHTALATQVIDSDTDIVPYLQNLLNQVALKHNFIPHSTGGEQKRALNLHLLATTNRTTQSQTFFTYFTTDVNFAFEAIATTNGTNRYEHIYRGHATSGKRHIMVPASKEVDNQLTNAALSQAINGFISDKKLWQFLAK